MRSPFVCRPVLLLLAISCQLLSPAPANAVPLYSVDRSQDVLVKIETETGAVEVIGLLGVDANVVSLAMLDGVLYAKNSFFNDHVEVLTINASTGAVISSVLVTYNGVPIRNAEAFGAVDGELLLGFSTNGSLSNSNAIGQVASNGQVTLIFDYSVIDPQADADGIVELPGGRLRWCDLEFPGTGDKLRFLEWSLPPATGYIERAVHTPLVAAHDLAYVRGKLWGLDFVEQRLVQIHHRTGALSHFVGIDPGYDLLGLTPAGLQPRSYRRARLSVVPSLKAQTLAFDLEAPTAVNLVVYDVAGRLVERLLSGTRGVGHHVVTWDSSKQPSGIYLYRFEAYGMVETKKTLVVQ